MLAPRALGVQFKPQNLSLDGHKWPWSSLVHHSSRWRAVEQIFLGQIHCKHMAEFWVTTQQQVLTLEQKQGKKALFSLLLGCKLIEESEIISYWAFAELEVHPCPCPILITVLCCLIWECRASSCGIASELQCFALLLSPCLDKWELHLLLVQNSSMFWLSAQKNGAEGDGKSCAGWLYLQWDETSVRERHIVRSHPCTHPGNNSY